jgi:ferritin-like metal-binding protein YciE
MSKAEQKVVQYLAEAHASEVGLVRDLQAQVAMTPRGAYRSALETHLRETRDHAKRLKNRLDSLGDGDSVVQTAVGLAESAVSQFLALGKAPFALLRGSTGEEKILKNAKDACATEALEIATYTAIEHLARSVGDDVTAELAIKIRGEEERMLERIMREIPKLAARIVDAEHDSSYEISETGAADAVREVADAGKQAARKAQGKARRTARSARKIPGVAFAEGEIKGAVASEGDLAISSYDKLTAAEVLDRLGDLSQIELAKVDAYERRNGDRSTILNKIIILRGQEPWAGYDELNVEEIRTVLSDSGEDRLGEVRSYERSHKNRAGVIQMTEREIAHA